MPGRWKLNSNAFSNLKIRPGLIVRLVQLRLSVPGDHMHPSELQECQNESPALGQVARPSIAWNPLADVACIDFNGLRAHPGCRVRLFRQQ